MQRDTFPSAVHPTQTREVRNVLANYLPHARSTPTPTLLKTQEYILHLITRSLDLSISPPPPRLSLLSSTASPRHARKKSIEHTYLLCTAPSINKVACLCKKRHQMRPCVFCSARKTPRWGTFSLVCCSAGEEEMCRTIAFIATPLWLVERALPCDTSCAIGEQRVC